MKREKDKIVEIYKNLTLDQKEQLLDLILRKDCYFFLHSDKRSMGFDLKEGSRAWASINGADIQVSIDIDDTECCFASSKTREEYKPSQIKLNSFVLPTIKKTKK